MPIRSPEELKAKRRLGIAFHAVMIVIAVGAFYYLIVNHLDLVLLAFIIGIIIFMTFHLHYVFEVHKMEKEAMLKA